MTIDFRAAQIQVNKLISSGSTGTNAQLLVYPIDKQGSPENQGNIDSSLFDTSGIGSDIFMFISGSISSSDSSGSYGSSVFGGDVVVSGTLRVFNPGLSGSNVATQQFAEDLIAAVIPDTSAFTLKPPVDGFVFAASLTDGGPLSAVAPLVYDSGLQTIAATVNADIGISSGLSVLFSFTGSNREQSGVYIVTDPGSGGNPAVFTRRSDLNTSAGFLNSPSVFWKDGGSIALFQMRVPDGFVLDTDIIDAKQVRSPNYTEGTLSERNKLNPAPLNNDLWRASDSTPANNFYIYANSAWSLVAAGATSVEARASIGASDSGLDDSTLVHKAGIETVTGNKIFQGTQSFVTASADIINVVRLNTSDTSYFSAILDMTGQKVVNLGAPTDDADATTKIYVDTGDTASEAAAATYTDNAIATEVALRAAGDLVAYERLATIADYYVNNVSGSTINTATFTVNAGTQPSNSLWTIKFISFHSDQVDPTQCLITEGAFGTLRNGVSDSVQLGATQIEHAYGGGTIAGLTISPNFPGGGSVEIAIQGVASHTILHNIKILISEYVFA